jgi:hypothetical protein
VIDKVVQPQAWQAYAALGYDCADFAARLAG